MQTTIPYGKETIWRAVGRNGPTRQSGLHVGSAFAEDEGVTTREVHLRPINSRGDLTNCRICVPVEAIPALVESLLAEHRAASADAGSPIELRLST